MKARSMIAIAACVAIGCATRGRRCDLDSDCRRDLVCWQYTGTCEQPCTDTSGCPEGRVCLCEPDRECPPFEEGTPVEDVEGGVCLAPIADADAEADAPGDPEPDPDAPDVPFDPDLPEVEVPDLSDVDCGSDGAPDVLPDGACVLPDSFPSPTFRMIDFHIGLDGNPGSGIDLDSNPSTCAPHPNLPVHDVGCSAGVDNAMFYLGFLANGYLPGGEYGAATHILVELAGYAEDGCPFAVNFYPGNRVPADPPECPEEGVCEFTVPAGGFDVECRAVSRIGDAWVSGTHLSGGPLTEIYYLMLSVVGLDLLIPVHRARIEADVVPGTSGPDSVSGIVGGYVIQTELMATFEAIPPEDYPYPYKDAVIELIQNLFDDGAIVLDTDLDGDTTPEAASLGIAFDTVPVPILGLDG